MLREFLAHYPGIGAWAAPSEAIAGLADQWWPGRGLARLNCVTLLWPDRGEPSLGGYSEDVTQHVGTAYFKDRYLFPALGDNTEPLHPLLAWWAMLYVLSMVARYDPCAWSDMIAINTSTEASAIEHLMETAVARLPRLILDVVDDLTA